MEPRRAAWLAFLRQAVRLSTFVAVAGLVADFGFPLEERARSWLRAGQLALIGLFAIESALRLAWSDARWRHLRANPLELSLLMLLVLDVAIGLVQPGGRTLTGAWFFGIQAYLVLRFALGLAAVQSWLTRRAARPALLLVGGYVIAALVGALLLSLPLTHEPHAPAWTFADAFFTATSAVCVTGLSVRDVGSELTLRGQGVLLFLIQLGGLGLVALVCTVGLAHTRRLSLREGHVLGEALGLGSPGRLKSFLTFALGYTLAVEALGAFALWLALEGDPVAGTSREWWAVFHSVSAFCNAGFGLSPQNAGPWAGSPAVLWILMTLIVLGGLGFAVHQDLLRLRPLSLATLRWVRWSALRRLAWPLRARVFAGEAPPQLSLNTRIVLRTSAGLLALGTVGILLAERSGALGDRSVGAQWLHSLFLSVSARTAGFAAFDLSALGLPTLLLMIVLMAVGASPLSTGGGVKTTTLAVAVLTVRALARGRDDVDVLGRRLPARVVHVCMAIVLLYFVLTCVVTILLVSTQPATRFEAALFEAVSALSTVGLSTGLTPLLDGTGRLILCAAMIAGRVGPLACLWSVLAQPHPLRYRYSQENLHVS